VVVLYFTSDGKENKTPFKSKKKKNSLKKPPKDNTKSKPKPFKLTKNSKKMEN
jgi:hypothetical protein